MSEGANLNQLPATIFTASASEFSYQSLLVSLRAELHAAVDEIVNRLADPVRANDTAASSECREGPQIRTGESFGSWTYRWPDGQEEEFSSGRLYSVELDSGSRQLRLAWTTRRAWGRERERAIVFLQVGGPASQTYYPLAEFVETDRSGDFASPVPDPSRPRALLSNQSVAPDRFRRAKLVRADEAFTTIEQGPSLRLIVGQDDEIEMVRHAIWVGTIRGRL